MTEETKQDLTQTEAPKAPDPAGEEAAENRLEILIAIFLGVTALLTAWASWIGSLHGGNQATNYTRSNNLAAEGNAEYNAATQIYLSDIIAWNSILDYQFDAQIAESNGNLEEAEMINSKMEIYMQQNCSQGMLDAIVWAMDQGIDTSPFSQEGFVDSYFGDANAILAESQDLLEQGMNDNLCGDKFGLVTVIYSLVLFLLGIVGIFKKMPNRRIVFGVSIVFLILATVYMFTIPLPTGFNFVSYFAGA